MFLGLHSFQPSPPHDEQSVPEAAPATQLAWALEHTPWEVCFCSEYALWGHVDAGPGGLPWMVLTGSGLVCLTALQALQLVLCSGVCGDLGEDCYAV